ncbi:hypothetical protein BCR32DRAFT_267955 [Anaeromyces robustus]|uniref:Ubiquitin-conjugating enzyme E2C-binding protein n=1 Tax=Anaeromyces robustus TaxID=1754192 RepID=A0A1Y1X898_9FUNG|nr:hypothetical protein BCR32DRAFT_267955 [Anaeromyces robustus]|eukprot:ORX81983.1 hypothetical protein BCR32DRAFT_267955 [Anaeromyces robustus]
MSIKFYSEYLSNINTLSITLFIKGVPPDLSINTFSLAFLSDIDNTKKNIITFPFKIIPSSLRISETDNTVILKLKTEKEWFNIKHNIISDMPIIYNSKLLKGISTLYCNKCNNQLSILNDSENTPLKHIVNDQTFLTFKRFIDLPSDHWFEMMDCWLCVPSDISRFEGQIGIGSMAAKENNILIGRTFLILHPNNIIPDCFKQKIYEIKQTLVYIWREIQCKNCKQNIGFVLINTSKNDTIVAVKLHKYKLNMDIFSNEKNEIIQLNKISFIECFVIDLFEYANSHASYKFVVKNEKGEPMGLIWLLNWNVYISTNNFGPENISSKAVKLLFIDCLKDPNSSLAQKWINDSQIDVLIYENQCCIELLNYLNQSNQAIPSDQRIFNNFNVGFITYTIKK